MTFVSLVLMGRMAFGQQIPSWEDPAVLNYVPPHPTEEMVKSVTYADEAPAKKTVMLPNGVELDLVGIGSGSFVMGNVVPRTGSGKIQQRFNINLGHRVRIARPYWIGRYEVTQKQYVAVLGNRSFPYAGDSLPACGVNWHDAKLFADKLNEVAKGEIPEGYKFDLPTEAQWEFACRALTTTEFNNGYDAEVTNKAFAVAGESMVRLNYLRTSAVADEVAWYADNASNAVHEVGIKNPNEWGLYDMHGNVAEWCLDCYNYFDGTNYVDPYFGDYVHMRSNPVALERFAGDDAHAARGGSFADKMSESLTSYGRLPIGAEQDSPILGLRVALVPADKLGLQVDTNDTAAYGVCPFTVNMKLQNRERALKQKETMSQHGKLTGQAKVRTAAAHARTETAKARAETASARAEAARAKAEAAKARAETVRTRAETARDRAEVAGANAALANTRTEASGVNVPIGAVSTKNDCIGFQQGADSWWKWLDMAMIGLDVAVRVVDSVAEIDNAIHRKNSSYYYGENGAFGQGAGARNGECNVKQSSGGWGTIKGPNSLGKGKSATYKLYVGGSLVNASWAQSGTSISVYGSGNHARVTAGNPPIKSGKFKTGIRAVYNGKTYQKSIYVVK